MRYVCRSWMVRGSRSHCRAKVDWTQQTRNLPKPCRSSEPTCMKQAIGDHATNAFGIEAEARCNLMSPRWLPSSHKQNSAFGENAKADWMSCLPADPIYDAEMSVAYPALAPVQHSTGGCKASEDADRRHPECPPRAQAGRRDGRGCRHERVQRKSEIGGAPRAERAERCPTQKGTTPGNTLLPTS